MSIVEVYTGVNCKSLKKALEGTWENTLIVQNQAFNLKMWNEWQGLWSLENKKTNHCSNCQDDDWKLEDKLLKAKNSEENLF